VKQHVQIQTSTMCTARCRICPHSTSMLAKQKAVMTDEVFQKIFRELSKAKIEIGKLPLYMQNEPLTDPKYLERLEFAMATSGAGYVEVSTNASLLSRDVSKKIVAMTKAGGKLTMILSFQGTTKQGFEDMTGLKYARVLKNIRAFLEECQGGGPSMVIHSYGDATKIQDFWQKRCQGWGLVRWPRIKVIAYTNRASNLKGQYAYDVASTKVKKCIRHSQWLHFNWKGDLIICCNDYENEVVYGNIMHESLTDLMAKIPLVVQLRSKDNPKFICRRCDARCIGQ